MMLTDVLCLNCRGHFLFVKCQRWGTNTGLYLTFVNVTAPAPSPHRPPAPPHTHRQTCCLCGSQV